jgi:hypothetical protein
MSADLKEEDPETYAIIGAAMEVHRELYHGFVEPIYQDAFAAELSLRKIPFEREKPLNVFYKGGVLPSTCKADFVCFGNPAGRVQSPPSQVLNYLRITHLTRALNLNFGTPSLSFKRLILTPENLRKNLR